MKKICSVLFMFVFIGCGKHEIDNSSFLASDNITKGTGPTTPEERMTLAISTANKAELEKLLAEGADVNMRLENDATPLIQSTVINVPLFVFILMQNGADPTLTDNKGKTAMDYAISIGGRDRIQLFLDPEKQMQLQSDLFVAVEGKKTTTIEKILKAGVTPNFIHDSGETPLTRAIAKNYLGVVKTLVKWKDPDFNITGTDIQFKNAAGVTPLGVAKQNDFKTIIDVLVPLGAEE